MNDKMYWNQKGGLVSWSYRFNYNPDSLNKPEIRKQWIINVTQSLLKILKPFATPHKVELGTFSMGDEAFIIQCEEPNYQDRLFQLLSSTDDITDVTIDLNLHCYEVDEHLQAKQITLWNSGFLWLYIGLDETGKLKTSRTWENFDPIRLLFSIDVDIYAPLVTPTEQRLETAKINAPILKNFLKRLEKELPLKLTDRDMPWYVKEYLDKL